MADPPNPSGASHGHLDARGPREVVFCHQCDNEWYQDEHGLKCPRCDGEATEIVTAENDPRSITQDPIEAPGDLHHHNPWPDDDVPDPDEGDLDDLLNHNHSPAGRTMFFSHTFTTGGPPRSSTRQNANNNDPAHVIRDFHGMIEQLMGPNLRPGQAGRSGPEALFNRNDPFGRANPVFGGATVNGHPGGPHVHRTRYTFTTGGSPGPRGDPEVPNLAAEDFATYAPPPVLSRRSPRGPTFVIISITAPPDQLASILGNLFGAMGPLDGHNAQRGPGPPPGLQGLFATLFNPANAVAGDAVYSQEALDRIISTLMEQHPTSNAPGPASAEAIANLPKKKVDEKMLGPELKAECSVCMDDVHLEEEVVVLPCTHWFHETCANAWLSEHNTCPICRTGIGADAPSPNPERASSRPSPNPSPADPMNPYARRASFTRRMSRNEARLEAIRDRGRLSMTPESRERSHRYQVVGDAPSRPNRTQSPSPPAMPGSFTSNSHFRRRGSQNDMSETQRESRRAATSGSDESRRSSHSGGSGGSGGPMGWLRRLGGGGSGGSRRRNE